MNAQAITAYAAVIAALVGGASAALITQLSTRKRTAAEIQKMAAETERNKAETAKLLREMPVPPSQPPEDSTPPGWSLTGSYPQDYDTGTDPVVAHSGTRSGFIASRESPRGFGTLMQTFSAEHLRKTRQQLTAYIKTADVDQWCALWMRVDGSRGKMLAFDNMENRPISGTTDWRPYHIVLDIPEEGDAIAFGILLNGPGRVWIDDIQIKPVGQDTPTTGNWRALEPEPTNLDFEQTDKPASNP